MGTLHESVPAGFNGEELSAEIIAELEREFGAEDLGYDKPANAIARELGPEIILTPSQRGLAVLYYVACINSGDAYGQGSETSPHGNARLGARLSYETGIYAAGISATVTKYLEEGLLAGQPANADVKSLESLQVTALGIKTLDEPEASKARDITVAEQYIHRYIRQTIVFVRNEIQQARETIGEEPAAFEPLTNFQNIAQLTAHLADLQKDFAVVETKTHKATRSAG